MLTDTLASTAHPTEKEHATSPALVAVGIGGIVAGAGVGDCHDDLGAALAGATSIKAISKAVPEAAGLAGDFVATTAGACPGEWRQGARNGSVGCRMMPSCHSVAQTRLRLSWRCVGGSELSSAGTPTCIVGGLVGDGCHVQACAPVGVQGAKHAGARVDAVVLFWGGFGGEEGEEAGREGGRHRQQKAESAAAVCNGSGRLAWERRLQQQQLRDGGC
jgi:hypothetical protein